jgi:hypothetical protein
VDVYVKTAGKKRALEYDWYRVTRQGHFIEAPSMLREYKVESLTQDQSFSVVFVRSRDRLMLLVGWMESGRFDFASRPIRNFVAWVGDWNDEPALRSVAVLALRGELDRLVDVTITEDGTGGFRIALEELEAISARPDLIARIGFAQHDPQPLWAENTEALRLELASQLERERLPERKGPLVVVTGLVSQQTLAEAQVWRALASTIKANQFTPVQKKKSKRAFSGCSVLLLTMPLISLMPLVIRRLIKK